MLLWLPHHTAHRGAAPAGRRRNRFGKSQSLASSFLKNARITSVSSFANS
jgi:hypothetical protein